MSNPNNNMQNQIMMIMSQNTTNQNMMSMSPGTSQNMMSMSPGISQNMMSMFPGISQNMMIMSPGISQNMMSMSPGISQNMMSMIANYLTPFIIKPKITSLIRVLQCLSDCFEDIGPIKNLKNMINAVYQNKSNKNSITLNILDALSRSINPDNNFTDSVYNLRNKINMKTNLFCTNEEVAPNLIFFFIFIIINDEYISEDFPYYNNIFSDLKTIEKIPKNYLPLILGKIKQFEQNGSPCINNFFYLFLDVIKCPNCNKIFFVNDQTILASHFLPLPGGMDGNVSDLIKYNIKEESEIINQSNKCTCGKNEGNEKPEKAFLNTPKYLFIDFEGQMKKQRQLEEKIDLSEYKLTNRGPDQYLLYAFIIKSIDKYMAFVKKGSSWVSYSDETTINSDITISFDYAPHYAIYRGLA